jgi:hypothetical protein
VFVPPAFFAEGDFGVDAAFAVMRKTDAAGGMGFCAAPGSPVRTGPPDVRCCACAGAIIATIANRMPKTSSRGCRPHRAGGDGGNKVMEDDLV